MRPRVRPVGPCRNCVPNVFKSCLISLIISIKLHFFDEYSELVLISLCKLNSVHKLIFEYPN